MYKVGKYKYQSLEQYQSILRTIFSIFLICIFFLIFLKESMNQYLFIFTISLAIIMMAHLFLRYAKARKWINNYIFNEY